MLFNINTREEYIRKQTDSRRIYVLHPHEIKKSAIYLASFRDYPETILKALVMVHFLVTNY